MGVLVVRGYCELVASEGSKLDFAVVDGLAPLDFFHQLQRIGERIGAMMPDPQLDGWKSLVALLLTLDLKRSFASSSRGSGDFPVVFSGVHIAVLTVVVVISSAFGRLSGG